MNRMFTVIMLIFTCGMWSASGQNFIGLHADDIKPIVKKEYPEFILNTSTVNKYFNYLKYENEQGTQTMLIFLDDQNQCTYFKRICDYVHLPEMTIQLNAHARRENDTLWVFQDNQATFSQVLDKGDWFFTITTRPVINHH